MFTFRRLTLFFFIILLCLNLWNVIPGKSAVSFVNINAVLLYSLLFSCYFGCSFAMAFLPCSNFHHPVLCRGTTDEKSVSITFDDGPDPVKTPLVLEILRKHQVYAAFFVIGKKIAGNEWIVKRLIDDGHVIGNHSFSHSKWFDFFPAHKIRAELLETDHLLKNITGKSPLFFRPPYGVVNPMVSNALKHMPWKAVCWNIRSFDTLNNNPEKIKTKIIRKLKPGSIILLHDDTLFTGNHLDELLVAIRQAGYTVVPLDKLLNIPAHAQE